MAPCKPSSFCLCQTFMASWHDFGLQTDTASPSLCTRNGVRQLRYLPHGRFAISPFRTEWAWAGRGWLRSKAVAASCCSCNWELLPSPHYLSFPTFISSWQQPDPVVICWSRSGEDHRGSICCCPKKETSIGRLIIFFHFMGI